VTASPLSFRSHGRGWHAIIEGAQDLRAVLLLEDAHWVATAATIDTLRADPVLLALIDADGDGRIRSDELRAAITWLFASLRGTGGIDSRSEVLDLSTVNPDGPDGTAILEAARRILGELGRAEEPRLGLADIRKVRADEESRGLSKAGRVQAAAAGDDAELAAFLRQVIAATDGVPHPLGDPAVDAACLDRFLAEGQAWLDWHDQGRLPEDGAATPVRPLGAATETALTAVLAVADKVDQYLLLCDTVALDPALAARAWIGAEGSDLLDRAVATALLDRAPLARPRADGLLDLDGALNPAWRGALATLAQDGLVPVHGAERRDLDRAGWQAIRAAVDPLAAWKAAEPPNKVGAEGAELLRARLGDARLAERTRALLAESETAAVLLDGVRAVEKLVLYQQGLLTLVNSFVAMPELFTAGKRALFEHGHLVMDGRVFDLAVRVNDAARAERFGGLSSMFIMYVMVGDVGATWTDQYAIPVTAGERGNLVEGMWGVFFDIHGKERHAQVRKIASSPISIKEALLAPFRKLSELAQSMADKAASEQTTNMSSTVGSATEKAVSTAAAAPASAVAAGEAASVTTTTTSEASPTAAPATTTTTATSSSKGMAGQIPMLLAGAGLAAAALASALAYVVNLIWSGAGSLAAAIVALPLVSDLPAGLSGTIQVLSLPVALILVLAGVALVPFLIYAIPVSIATWLRLRKRDLATLLEGSGWAINTRIFLTKDLAGRITTRPGIPTSAVRR